MEGFMEKVNKQTKMSFTNSHPQYLADKEIGCS